MSTGRLSLSNHMTAATVTGLTEATDYEAVNVREPGRPFLPWRTTAITQQTLTVDFGSAVSLGMVVLVHANFTSFKVQAHTADSWATPDYDSGDLTMARNPWNRRYMHALYPGVTKRWLRLVIAAQTPVDAAGYFSLGGLWVGPKTDFPRDMRWAHDVETIEPRQDVGPSHGGWVQRLRLGSPRSRLRLARDAEITTASPAVSDELASWLDVERQMFDGDLMAVALRDDVPRLTWIVRRGDAPEWRVDTPLAEGTLVLDEAVA